MPALIAIGDQGIARSPTNTPPVPKVVENGPWPAAKPA